METVVVCVLGYKEFGRCVAHALEMDLIGVGDSWGEALEVLKGVIDAQIACAKELGDDSMIFSPAPPHLFKRFKEAPKGQPQNHRPP